MSARRMFSWSVPSWLVAGAQCRRERFAGQVPAAVADAPPQYGGGGHIALIAERGLADLPPKVRWGAVEQAGPQRVIVVGVRRHLGLRGRTRLNVPASVNTMDSNRPS
jgi:hypothetical protein